METPSTPGAHRDAGKKGAGYRPIFTGGEPALIAQRRAVRKPIREPLSGSVGSPGTQARHDAGVLEHQPGTAWPCLQQA